VQNKLTNSVLAVIDTISK